MSKLKFQFFALLAKLQFYLRRRILKKIANTETLLSVTAQYHIRMKDRSFAQFGASKEHDDVLFFVSQRLFQNEIAPQDVHLYESHKDAVEKIAGDFQDNPDIMRLRLYFFCVSGLKFKLLGMAEDGQRQLAKVKLLQADLTELDFKAHNRIRKEVIKEFRSLHYQVGDRTAIKLDLELEHVSVVLALLSSLLVIGGYLYTEIFYSWFGIHASKYFSLADYLASSIDKMSIALFASLTGMAAAFIGYSDLSRTSYHLYSDRRKKFGYI